MAQSPTNSLIGEMALEPTKPVRSSITDEMAASVAGTKPSVTGEDIFNLTAGDMRKGLRTGMNSLGADYNALAGQAGLMLGLEDFAADRFKDAENYAIASQTSSGEIKDLSGVKDLTTATQFAANIAGQSIPAMLPAIGLGLRMKNPVKGAFLGFLPGAAGQQTRTLREDPEVMATKTPGEILGNSLAAGAAVSGINATLGAPGQFVNRARAAVPRTTFGKATAEAALSNAAAEPLSDIAGQVAHQQLNPNKELDTSKLLEEALVGGVMGGAFGAAGHAVGSMPEFAKSVSELRTKMANRKAPIRLDDDAALAPEKATAEDVFNNIKDAEKAAVDYARTQWDKFKDLGVWKNIDEYLKDPDILKAASARVKDEWDNSNIKPVFEGAMKYGKDLAGRIKKSSEKKNEQRTQQDLDIHDIVMEYINPEIVPHLKPDQLLAFSSMMKKVAENPDYFAETGVPHRVEQMFAEGKFKTALARIAEKTGTDFNVMNEAFTNRKVTDETRLEEIRKVLYQYMQEGYLADPKGRKERIDSTARNLLKRMNTPDATEQEMRYWHVDALDAFGPNVDVAMTALDKIGRSSQKGGVFEGQADEGNPHLDKRLDKTYNDTEAGERAADKTIAEIEAEYGRKHVRVRKVFDDGKIRLEMENAESTFLTDKEWESVRENPKHNSSGLDKGILALHVYKPESKTDEQRAADKSNLQHKINLVKLTGRMMAKEKPSHGMVGQRYVYDMFSRGMAELLGNDRYKHMKAELTKPDGSWDLPDNTLIAIVRGKEYRYGDMKRANFDTSKGAVRAREQGAKAVSEYHDSKQLERKRVAQLEDDALNQLEDYAQDPAISAGDRFDMATQDITGLLESVNEDISDTKYELSEMYKSVKKSFNNKGKEDFRTVLAEAQKELTGQLGNQLRTKAYLEMAMDRLEDYNEYLVRADKRLQSEEQYMVDNTEVKDAKQMEETRERFVDEETGQYLYGDPEKGPTTSGEGGEVKSLFDRDALRKEYKRLLDEQKEIPATREDRLESIKDQIEDILVYIENTDRKALARDRKNLVNERKNINPEDTEALSDIDSKISDIDALLEKTKKSSIKDEYAKLISERDNIDKNDEARLKDIDQRLKDIVDLAGKADRRAQQIKNNPAKDSGIGNTAPKIGIAEETATSAADKLAEALERETSKSDGKPNARDRQNKFFKEINTKYSSMELGKRPIDPETEAEVRKYVERVLGKDAEVLIRKLKTAGSFSEMDGIETLRISIDAADPMSVAYHEAVHALMARLMKADPKAANILMRAANAPGIVSRLKNLLKDHPDALKQLDDPEERVAYLYQFAAAGEKGLINLGPQTKTVFEKVKSFFLKIAAIWDDSFKTAESVEKAEQILAAFHDGELANKSTVAQVLQDMFPRSAEETVDRLAPWASKLANKFAYTAAGAARDIGNKDLTAIIDKFYTDIEARNAEPGYLQAKHTEYNKQINRVVDILNEIPGKAEQKVVWDDLHTGAEATTKQGIAIRGILNDLHNYLVESGVKLISMDSKGNLEESPLQKRAHYFPRVYDQDILNTEKGKREFLELLDKHKVPKKEALQAYRNITNEVGVTPDSTLGLTYYTPHTRGRALGFIPDSELAPFLSTDMYGTLSQYIRQAVRRAEYAKRFGNTGDKIETAVKEAEKAGVTPAQIAVFKDSVAAMDGSIGGNMSPELRNLYSGLMTYQNVRLLPLQIFSSLIDPLGIVVRGGELKDAFAAFGKGLRDIVKTDDKDYAFELAKTVGAIDASNSSNLMSELSGSNYMPKLAREINNKFFKYNGMEAWNTRMRAQASVAAENFIIKHAERPNEHSARYLEELNLTKDDIQVVNEKLVINDKIAQAINKWVDEAIIRPNPAHRPVYMSDPNWMLISHLKQYTYLFQKVIAARVYHEITQGNYKPAMALASYVPAMIAADMMKVMLTPGSGDDNGRAGWTAADWVGHGIQRAGIFGPSQLGLDAGQDMKRGGIGIESLAGPTVQQLLNFAQGASQGSLGLELKKAVPGYALIKPAG